MHLHNWHWLINLCDRTCCIIMGILTQDLTIAWCMHLQTDTGYVVEAADASGSSSAAPPCFLPSCLVLVSQAPYFLLLKDIASKYVL